MRFGVSVKIEHLSVIVFTLTPYSALSKPYTQMEMTRRVRETLDSAKEPNA